MENDFDRNLSDECEVVEGGLQSCYCSVLLSSKLEITANIAGLQIEPCCLGSFLFCRSSSFFLFDVQ